MQHSGTMPEEATTRFVRPAVDCDDTIPVALYSRPYERVEIAALREGRRAAPPPALPRGVFVAVLLAAFTSGFALVVLLLG